MNVLRPESAIALSQNTHRLHGQQASVGIDEVGQAPRPHMSSGLQHPGQDREQDQRDHADHAMTLFDVTDGLRHPGGDRLKHARKPVRPDEQGQTDRPDRATSLSIALRPARLTNPRIGETRMGRNGKKRRLLSIGESSAIPMPPEVAMSRRPWVAATTEK